MSSSGSAATMKLEMSWIDIPKIDMKASARPTTIASQKRWRNFVRQYQTRRRETMSSSTSSRPAPYMLARVQETAERDDEDERADERPQERPVVLDVEERERDGAREHRHEGCGAG